MVKLDVYPKLIRTTTIIMNSKDYSYGILQWNKTSLKELTNKNKENPDVAKHIED